MLKINSNEDIKKLISDNEIIIIYFSNKVCGACDVIRNKVESILEAYPKVKLIDIDGEEQIELAALNNVFSFPLLILYVDGKEVIRVGRNVNLLELENTIKRYYDLVFYNIKKEKSF
ncbi:thioredoxin family protein [Clostridium cellulovorans]|uniref:Thioredoxin domain-containing protein n=1 Tax=Clostridium cellulovorans (strain ATCC 35296 / DSM 3052 / OCM 3 / 743B) TaxID=573061 RepID=D9STV9_CLOC7|nr:thioredoxin family protein [Clostridium cellulovorans]ADL50797.1 Thioredoxin domain-containing protein [Clostridium cellulovorans 743B]